MKIKKLLSVMLLLAMMICTIVPVSAATGFSATNIPTINYASLSSATLYYSVDPNKGFTIGSYNSNYYAVNLTVSGRNISTNSSFGSGVIYVIVVAKDTNNQTYLYGYNVQSVNGYAPGGVQQTTSGQITVAGSEFTKCYQIPVYFDANGGNVSQSYTYVTKGLKYGTIASLPTPTHTNNEYTFAGWYTSATGGTQVTNQTQVPTNISYQQLYAHWTVDNNKAFSNYKTEKANELSNYMQATDSTVTKDIIFNGCYTINGLTYNSSLTLEQNKIIIDGYVLTTKNAADKQRALEASMSKFEEYKNQQTTIANNLVNEEDSEAVKSLVTQATSEIAALTYDENKTLDGNKAAVTAIINTLSTAIDAQREAEKPTALFTETIADAGYTAEAADSEDIKGAIAVTVAVENAVNFTLDDIAKYGFFYWRTVEGDLGINSEVAGSLSVTDPQFNTVVYDIDNAEENVLVKPYLVLNNGKTIYGDTISHTLNELNYNAEGKWLGTIETMLESLK